MTNIFNLSKKTMDTLNKLPPEQLTVAQLINQIEELKITMAIKEEDAYLRGRNDCIRQYFTQKHSQYPSSTHFIDNQS